MNAFERNGAVVLDLIKYDRMCASVAHGPWESLPNALERWTIDPRQGAVTQTVIDHHYQELPRIDERRIGLPYRYGYTVGVRRVDGGGVAMDALLKHDLQNRLVQRRRLAAGEEAGECVFVPARAEGAEDEGWVLCLVQDRVRGAATLLILDAQDFAGEPVASVELPARVPLGFHGDWLPDPVSPV
jgi:carotenoid cleavage dioxygenase